ncbi:phosphatidylinositol transfer protein 3-like [Hibiscus syriacus]|uniref:phosphatidylinositol transfer protein 3-like n=1 Tax=Hibiscus syriacus TaxID=106335 RepID=UPI0019246023|nr:phosphatidylinositol transfer protein 3-like [Hibiscus syriacus]
MMNSHSTNKNQEEEEEDRSENNEIEKIKICRMRTLVETQDPSSKEVDDSTLRRILRARDLDVEKASAMFLKYLKWRRSFVPNGFISPSELENKIRQNKMFLQGLDKKGRPVGVLLAGRHFQHKGGVEEFKRFIVYIFDKIFAWMPRGQEKFLVIGDLEGWGYANCDIRAYLAALSLVQDYYPERLGKLFIVHAPYIFMAAWKIVYPFIDVKTRNQIVFVENKKLKSTLLEDIDESQLPETYGGQVPLIPIQHS